MSKDWSYGLFDCCGDRKSCTAVFCCGLLCHACDAVGLCDLCECCCDCCGDCFDTSCVPAEIYQKGELGSANIGILAFCFMPCLYPCIFTGRLRAKKGIKMYICIIIIYTIYTIYNIINNRY